MKYRFLLLFLLIVGLVKTDSTYTLAQGRSAYSIQGSPQSIDKLELPKIKNTDHIINHTGFIISFNTNHLQANWVAFCLNKTNLSNHIKRSGKFRKDPLFPACAADNDYKHSGYDRGHLFTASYSWSEPIMEESFYFTNISPQESSFNKGIWKSLEMLIKTWAVDYGKIYVVTGPVLKKGLNSIGKGVSVPELFYKVVLDYNDKRGIGFILKNENNSIKHPVNHQIIKSSNHQITNTDLSYYAVSIDSVEVVTGIDFFSKLPDSEEKQIEAKVEKNKWKW